MNFHDCHSELRSVSYYFHNAAALHMHVKRYMLAIPNTIASPLLGGICCKVYFSLLNMTSTSCQHDIQHHTLYATQPFPNYSLLCPSWVVSH